MNTWTFSTVGLDQPFPLPSEQVVRCGQPHSNQICHPDDSDDLRAGADGFFFARDSQTPVSIRTADCAPVLLASTDHLCLVHIGWRCLADGILDTALACFAQADDEPSIAYIGAFYPQFLIQHDECYQRLHRVCTDDCFEHREEGIKFDFQRAITQQLPCPVITSPLSTYETPWLGSWRRDQDRERQNHHLLLPSSNHHAMLSFCI